MNPLINPSIGLIIWTTLVFVILLFVLAKFAFKPIVSALKDREKSINDALASADKAKEEMAQLATSNEQLLAKAKEERDTLIKEAQETAKQIVAESKSKAQEEGEAMILKAKNAIEGERKVAVEDMKAQAVSLSLEIAEKVLRRELEDKQAQENLLAEYLKETQVTA